MKVHVEETVTYTFEVDVAAPEGRLIDDHMVASACGAHDELLPQGWKLKAFAVIQRDWEIEDA